jgi:hypothetical protein
MSNAKLIVKGLKPSSNGKSVMANFELSYTTTNTGNVLTAFQKAQGMKEQEYVNDILRYATERLSPEAAAGLKEGDEIAGFTIQGYQSATPIYVVDGVQQKAAKNGAFFDGRMVPCGLGESMERADEVITMDANPEFYRVVTGATTVRGIAAVQLLKDLRAAAAATQTPVDAAPVAQEAANATV